MSSTLCNQLPSLIINYKVLEKASKLTSLEILAIYIELIDCHVV